MLKVMVDFQAETVYDVKILIVKCGGVGIFAGTEPNGTDNAIVAYLDCIRQLGSIIFIVFVRDTNLSGASVYQLV